jgi:predicted branched-subunit amino acid permease
MSSAAATSPRPTLTLDGARLGALMTLPTVPGIVVFGAAFGAASAAKGLTFGESMAMSAFIYAGMSQMVALEAWPAIWTWGAVLNMAVLVAVVNSRMVLMGAALHAWVRHYSPTLNAGHLFLLTDVNWLIGMRHQADGGRDLGVLFGAGLFCWGLWIAATGVGYGLGGLVTDPKRFALDLVMPIYFAALLVPMWKGVKPAAPWVVAGLVALTVSKLVPGQWHILVGALAGMIAGAAFGQDEPDKARARENAPENAPEKVRSKAE